MKELPLVQCCAPIASGVSDHEAGELAALFSALADPARVKILSLVVAAEDEEVCVCHLEEPLGLAQPTVSYHLKKLSDAGLLERERRGTFAYYRLAPGALERLRSVFAEPAVV